MTYHVTFVATVFQPSQGLDKTLACKQKTGLDLDPGKSQGKYAKKEREREKLSLTPYLVQTCRTHPISCAKGELLRRTAFTTTAVAGKIQGGKARELWGRGMQGQNYLF